MTDIDREGDLLAGVDEATPGGPPNPLIASDRVEGTAVFNCAGDKIGTVRRFLVEKRTGRALYAEMEFGGFLGLGKESYPLPWEVLDYDLDKGGYVVNVTDDQLRSAPHYEPVDNPPLDPILAAQVRGYYGII